MSCLRGLSICVTVAAISTGALLMACGDEAPDLCAGLDCGLYADCVESDGVAQCECHDDATHVPMGFGCVPRGCGNDVVEPELDEECDDGEENSDTAPDTCRTSCRLPRCGDGVTDATELCDDGNAVSGDGCDPDCQGLCGNEIVEPPDRCVVAPIDPRRGARPWPLLPRG